LTSFAPEAPQRWFARAIFGFDVWLRRRHGVFEYSANPDCIFRLELVRLEQTVVLSDGTTFAAGDQVAQLHLWNEQIPAFPAHRTMLHWACRMHRCVAVSLRDLAHFLHEERELQSVLAVRAEIPVGTADHAAQLLRICRRYGFRTVQRTEPLPLLAELHRLGENVLIAAIVLARNPQAFRLGCLRRRRAAIVLPRAVLDQRYRRAGLGSREVARRAACVAVYGGVGDP
jgi:hypothetical protein